MPKHTAWTSVELRVYITPPTLQPSPRCDGLIPFPSKQTMSGLGLHLVSLTCSIESKLLFRLVCQGCQSLAPPNLQHGCLCYFSGYPDSSSLDSFEEFSFDPFNIWFSRAVFKIGGNCFPLRSALVKIPLQAFALRLYFGSAFGSSISLR